MTYSFATTIALLALPASLALAQRPAAPTVRSKGPLVEFEMMTWPEVKQALAEGKTTALIYTGGTEQRGPQNVNGGHNIMGRAIVKEIAIQLGNAIAMPVLPYTPNSASATLPGTIGLTPDLLGAVLERVAEQSIVTGFKTIILMGDHGGGQGAKGPYADVAAKLEAKYAAQGVHVFYGDEVYAKAQGDFDVYLKSKNLPVSGHAGIPDTGELMYLCGAECVRLELVKDALGDLPPAPGETRDPNAPRKNNGISGDARKATAELGKKQFDIKIEYGVRQIKAFQASIK